MAATRVLPAAMSQPLRRPELPCAAAAARTAGIDRAGGRGTEPETALGRRGRAGGGGSEATVGGTVIRDAPGAMLPESAVECGGMLDECSFGIAAASFARSLRSRLVCSRVDISRLHC